MKRYHAVSITERRQGRGAGRAAIVKQIYYNTHTL